MNRSLDKIVKQAKRTGRKVARRRSLSETEVLKKVVEKRESEQETRTVRVWGPYQESATKFRLKIAEGGVERSLIFRTLEEAEEVKEELLRKHSHIQQITVHEALMEWSHHLEECRGIKPRSAKWVVQISRYWLPPHRPLSHITELDAKQIYTEHVRTPCPRTRKPPSAATHHEQLLTVRRFWDWGIEQGYCRHNPWKSVRKIGRRPKGKPQLRIDEARRLEAVALRLAKGGDATALGVLLMIYLGLRQGEVAARVARDVDDEGRMLWIPSGKTHNAKRRLKVPQHLQQLLRELARSRRPKQLLFYPESQVFHPSYYVNRVRRLCKEAGVPVVVPHSLRGLHATLALDGGATADAVARALGHGSFAVTKQHYASASSVDNARAEKVAETLTAKAPTEKSPNNQLAFILKSLPSDQLVALLEQLQIRHPQAPTSEENPTN